MKAACIVDSSVVLAVLLAETNWRATAELLPLSAISTANLAEVAARLSRTGLTAQEAEAILNELPMEAIPLARHTAIAAGLMEQATKALGLSMGDRICIALGQELGLPVYTADRKWISLPDAAERDIRLIR